MDGELSYQLLESARPSLIIAYRYLQANWDLNEVLAKKDEIVHDNLLVTKLAGPARAV